MLSFKLIWGKSVSEAPASIAGPEADNDDVEATPRVQREGGYQLLSSDIVRILTVAIRARAQLFS